MYQQPKSWVRVKKCSRYSKLAAGGSGRVLIPGARNSLCLAATLNCTFISWWWCAKLWCICSFINCMQYFRQPPTAWIDVNAMANFNAVNQDRFSEPCGLLYLSACEASEGLNPLQLSSCPLLPRVPPPLLVYWPEMLFCSLYSMLHYNSIQSAAMLCSCNHCTLYVLAAEQHRT